MQYPPRTNLPQNGNRCVAPFRPHGAALSNFCCCVVGILYCAVGFAREAARIARITENNFSRSRRSNQGRILENTLVRLFRENAGQRAIRNIAELTTRRENLSVAMRANEWLAGLNGVSPSSKVEVEHHGQAQSVGMLVTHPDAAAPELFDQIFPAQAGKASALTLISDLIVSAQAHAFLERWCSDFVSSKRRRRASRRIVRFVQARQAWSVGYGWSLV